MLPAILGRKIGMTQIYDDQGVLHPVTVVQAGPCRVLQVKTVQTDGYDAVQLGLEDVKVHRARKPQIGHAAKAGAPPQRFLREIRLGDGPADVSPGQQVTVESFEGVACVDVTGTTKGKGFAGTMKRHHFAGQPMSHGTERKHRSPGSLSAHATNRGWGGDIKKGTRMAGHMGAVRCTSRNHRLVKIDRENHLLLIKGPLPGAAGGLLIIRRSKTARPAQSAESDKHQRQAKAAKAAR